MMQKQKLKPLKLREPMTSRRKSIFLEALRRGLDFRRAALAASRYATTPKGAAATFWQAMQRDAQFALRVAEVRSAR
jgi:hypothetical protein